MRGNEKMKNKFTYKCMAGALSLTLALSLLCPQGSSASAKAAPKFKKTYQNASSDLKYTIANVSKGQKVVLKVTGSGKSGITLLRKGKKVKNIKVTAKTVSFTAKVRVNSALNGKKAIITATVYSKKKKKVKTITDTVTLKQKKTLPYVEQNSTHAFTITLKNAAGSVSADQIQMVNAQTQSVCAIKTAYVDAKNNKKIHFETYTDLLDGNVYRITYNGISMNLKVTDGVVGKLGVSPVTIPCEALTTINLLVKDKNGVVLETVPYGSSRASAYQFNITTSQGYTNGSKLYLNAPGSIAVATAVWTSGKYDGNGRPVGNVTMSVTIHAGQKQAITVKSYNMHLDSSGKSYQDTQNHQIAAGETKTAYFCFIDSTGSPLSSYSGYSLSSTNKDVLIVGSLNTSTKTATITAVSQGNAMVLVSDSAGHVVASIPVNITAPRTLSGIEVSDTSFELSASTSADDSKTVTVTAKDQYGDTMPSAVAKGKIKITCQSHKKTDGSNSTKYPYNSTNTNSSDGKVTFKGSSFSAGTYVYVLTVGNYSKTVTITVKTPSSQGKVSYQIQLSKTTADAAVNSSSDANESIVIHVAKYRDGILSSYLTSARSESSDIKMTIKKDGQNVSSSLFSFNKKSDKNYFHVTKTSSGKVKKAPAGTYQIQVTFGSTTLNQSFTITDTQKPLTVKCETDTVSKASYETVVTKAFSFTYNGKTYTNASVSGATGMSSSDVTNVKTLGSGPVHFQSATVYIPIDGVKVPFSVTLGKTITFK